MRNGLLTHIGILALLALVGLTALWMESLSVDSPGGLLPKFAFVKVAWIFIGIYALFSSLVVGGVAAVSLMRKRRLSIPVVMLCHVIPVLIVVIGVQSGIHDAVQDMLDGPRYTGEKRIDVPERPRLLPPSPPLPVQNYTPGGSEIEPDTHEGSEDSGPQ